MFLILPLIGPLYLNNLNPHPQSCFPPCLVEIGQVVCEKLTDGRTDGRMNAGQIAMAKAHLSLRLR